MCGIAGILDTTRKTGRDTLHADAERMTECLAHRGPDSCGLHVDERSGLALGHRRLAIIDLSAAGAQPMLSQNGRFALVLNGEIYNFQELRKELESEGGPFLPWRGSSDTEVLLAAVEAWGVEAALRRMLGMFAFALWDNESRKLHLARDRFGEKPLYCSMQNGLFLFGSEAKSLAAHPGFTRTIDPESVSLFLRYQYIPAPKSIWQGVFKLEPGTLLTVDRSGAMTTEPYWSLADAVEHGRIMPFPGEPDEAAREMETLLTDAVRLQMVSDVPLGTLLSGGIDSSLITALAQKVSNRPVRTFTIGYDDGAYDEAPHARAVAEHLGTDHTELIVPPEQCLDLIPRLAEIWDEPFADASMLPTALVSELTRQHVTVCLSGDGGDESFGGYNRHVSAPPLWNRLSALPAAVRKVAANGILGISPRTLDSLYTYFEPLLPGSKRMTNPGFKAHKLARVMAAPTREAMYTALCSTWMHPEQLLGTQTEPNLPDAPEGLSFRQWMQYQDTLTYLPGDILAKVDRAAMAFSLETRAPYLDHRVVELAWTLPESVNVSGGVGKKVLRTILDRHVPREITDRPKTGFGVPLGGWLRGPLREWADDLLHPRRLEQQGVINSIPVVRALNEHMSGRRDNEHQLWTVLMLQTWLDHWT